MNGQRVLVTGAAGFVGSHVVEALATVADEVWMLDGFVGNYDAAIKHQNVEEVLARTAITAATLDRTDLRDRAGIERLLTRIRPDVVVHCAALAGVRPSVDRPALYAEHNVIGTINLLEAMHAAGCTKLVFTSSSSVYGETAKAPFAEDQPAVRPVSPYAAAKRAAELFLHTYAGLYGLDYVALRLFTVYGRRQRPDLAIHRFTRAILTGEPITMNGDGLSSRDYTHVDDIVSGVVGAVRYLDDHDEVQETVNLGSSSPVLLRDLIEIVAKACGREAVVQARPDQPGDVLRTYADVTKAKRLFGYEPRRDLVAGIDDFVRWWRGRFLP